jgi:hypothetical protein
MFKFPQTWQCSSKCTQNPNDRQEFLLNESHICLPADLTLDIPDLKSDIKIFSLKPVDSTIYFWDKMAM